MLNWKGKRKYVSKTAARERRNKNKQIYLMDCEYVASKLHGWRQSSTRTVKIVGPGPSECMYVYEYVFVNWSILINWNDKQIAENHGGRP